MCFDLFSRLFLEGNSTDKRILIVRSERYLKKLI